MNVVLFYDQLENVKKNYVQYFFQGKFRFEGPSFPSVQELILYQFHSGQSVTSRSGAILKSPVLRERWELNNDDVELVEKIGRVSSYKLF